MALDLKILACVAFFVVMVHGRAGNPDSERREMLLRVLSQLQDERNNPPYRRDGETEAETGTTESQPPTTEATVEENTDDAETGNQLVGNVIESLQALAGEECGYIFDENSQGDDNEEFGPAEFFLELGSVSERVYECLSGNADDGETTGFDDDETADFDDDETTDFDDEVVPDLDAIEATETPDETMGDGEETDESVTEAPEPPSTVEPDTDTEDVVERELLKDLLKERLSRISRKGYNGKK